MKYTVYVIKNERGKFYTGQTANLDKRLLRHNQKLPNKPSSFTSINRAVWVLVYSEEFETRREAQGREKFLKSGKGREFLKSNNIRP